MKTSFSESARSSTSLGGKSLQRGTLLAASLFYAAGSAAAAKTDPPQIPKHLSALGSKAELLAAKTIWVTAESRRKDNPSKAETISWLRERGVKALAKTPYSLAASPAVADLWMELLVEPNLRYGPYHYQNLPYYFLILRDRREQKMVYCGYQRAGFDLFKTAIGQLLQELEGTLKHMNTTPTEPLGPCTEQAMRPVVHLGM